MKIGTLHASLIKANYLLRIIPHHVLADPSSGLGKAVHVHLEP